MIARVVEIEGVAGELWFRIADTNIRFGVLEFALMIELSFADWGIDLNEKYLMPGFSCLQYYGGMRPSINEHRDFRNVEIELSDSPGDYVKIANLLFAYRSLRTWMERENWIHRHVCRSRMMMVGKNFLGDHGLTAFFCTRWIRSNVIPISYPLGCYIMHTALFVNYM